MGIKVLEADCGASDAYIVKDLTSLFLSSWFLQCDFSIPSSTLTALAAKQFSAQWLNIFHSGGSIEDAAFLTGWSTAGASHVFSFGNRNYWTESAPGNPVSGGFTADAWHTLKVHWDGANVTWNFDGSDLFTYASTFPDFQLEVGGVSANHVAGEIYYIDNVKVGTTDGGSDIFLSDFESGDFSDWDSTHGGVSVVDDPLGTGGPSTGGGGPGATTGRVLIAFNDGPLEPSPTWTRIDGGDSPFPVNFVSGYDVESGRQTLISQTDTGTATVYINDHKTALFDPRNVSSPYFGLLDGRQILLQLYDPVAAAWEDQFRGLIDDITWDIDGSAVGADGFPINASIQIDCVDMFDYLAGYGLTPGLDGITPRTVPSGTAGGAVPVGMEDGVYYAETAGTVDDRFIEILTDAAVDSTRYTVASGNIHALAVKYDPDESALQALRDAADAEFPFIANIYCDRHGDFQFRGRYSRFDPDGVAAEPGSTWDFTRWAVGDGAAIIADSTRAQLRTFSFGRARSELINAALCYPKDLAPIDMPGQVYADTTSITAYGKHSAAPMSDLLTGDYAGPGTITPTTGTKQCALYAELLVKNQKDPRENITTLGLKSMQPDGSTRATKTWALITKADIAHIVNAAVGYPAGTGLAGASPDDDYYIEGRRLRVRAANATYDYVELDLDVSPAVWSMDTHSVFPALGS